MIVEFIATLLRSFRTRDKAYISLNEILNELDETYYKITYHLMLMFGSSQRIKKGLVLSTKQHEVDHGLCIL